MKIAGTALIAALLLAPPAAAGTNPCVGPDWDSDGVVDICDNCSEVFNTGQYDGDQDGYGDQCDGDYSTSRNGYVDGADFGQFISKFGTFVPPTSCEFDHAIQSYIDGGDFGRFITFFGKAPGPSCQPAPGGTRGIPCPNPGSHCPGED